MVLRETYEGEAAPTVAVAEDAGQSKKAAENWWNGENPQGLTAFVNSYRNNPRFAAFARYYLLGHSDEDPQLQAQLHAAQMHMDEAAKRMGIPANAFALAMQFALSHTIRAEEAETHAAEACDDAMEDLFGSGK